MLIFLYARGFPEKKWEPEETTRLKVVICHFSKMQLYKWLEKGKGFRFLGVVQWGQANT